MTRGVPMIDPKRDLKGATPEKLARALLRNKNLSRRVGSTVAGKKIPQQKITTDKPRNRVSHRLKRV